MKLSPCRPLVLIVASTLVLSVAAYESMADERAAGWAQQVEVDGVPNLFKVSDTLYRSAQPTAQGMQGLKALGIKTVVNLRLLHSDRDELAGTGLASESIAFKPWYPEKEDVVRFLKIVTDPDRTPVLVHCQHGADRTGTMCAMYRIAVQGWSKDEAIREMTAGGFNFHAVLFNLPLWIKQVDVEEIRKAAGLEAPANDLSADGLQPSEAGKDRKQAQ